MNKLSGNNSTVMNSSLTKWSFNDGGSFQHLDPSELRVLVPAILGFICVLGLACNFTGVAILFSNAHRGKLSLINSLIFNLMFADGLVLLFTVPFRAVSYSRPSWSLGWVACKTSDWFFHSCMAAKSFTVAVMAKACYCYVSNPTKQVSIHLGSILLVFLFIWLSACTVPIPHWLFATLQPGLHGLTCVLQVPPEAWGFMFVYIKAYPLGVYCAPLSFSLLYFWKAYSQCQRRSSKTQNLRTQIRSRKLTLMLFNLTIATAVLWLPQWVVWVWERLSADGATAGSQNFISPPPLLIALSAQLLSFSLSLVNPLIVLCLSEEFREGYRGLWRRLTLRKHPPSKPGPHKPTSLQSPRPRPETSGQERDERRVGPMITKPGTSRDAAPEQGAVRAGGDVDKDGLVLPDVEQFWHERESGSHLDENDPVPWEHQDHC
ncbi:G-protein coupled receptor 151 [Syngnathoides biaculeatus]|uniref:G-protein coupled receptor 151 n=1 Tax=Syngnathoides biaculeatus TaxID=300417 RepID=UPI002ADD4378|nr:G-protein coupled receptor 151 [Syngnathoides biaculeatus]XP_061691080.1 G-protein coupled receptor 151 [Syngnathoides biaculeatus]XP_061691081.1 G-protein coupled receptor 151 [Syngnathoides biaculeatus]